MEISKYTINAGLKEPLTAIVAADLHSGEYREILDKAAELKADMILCPGDVVHRAREDEKGLEFLRKASELCRVYCSMGNHESKHGTDIRDAIRATGALLLDDSFELFGGIAIGGMSSGYRYGVEQGRIKKTPPPNAEALKDFFEADCFKLLLCHHPEYFDSCLKDKNVDLVVSGHAHGGQWRVFGRGIFAPGQGLFPKYTHGLYKGRLLVSRGLSNHVFIPRIFNKPELVFLRLM